MKIHLHKSLFVLLFVLAGHALVAQSELQKAQSAYEIGKIELAEKILLNGLSTKSISETQDRKDAYELLAFISLDVDSMAKAEYYARQILELDAWYEGSSDNPEQFKKIIAKLKEVSTDPQVTTVSKNAESLYEAPATVILIEQKDILERGYNDLEELLHDLPGFDISRSGGLLYSHLYMRGFRSESTTRMLFLIDGVEQNDMWSNVIAISRQYPLTNIKSVEVVYGPASTIYGANAFVGVVSITTKNPLEMAKGEATKKGPLNYGIFGQLNVGSYNTQSVDVTAAISPKKNENLSAYVTFRYFNSDNNDLSNYPEFDFAAIENNDSTNVMYRDTMRIKRPSKEAVLLGFKDPNNIYHRDSGEYVVPTQFAIDEARRLDNEFYNNTQYQNKSYSYYVNTKIKIYDFTIGFEYQINSEGPGSWYQDSYRGGKNDNVEETFNWTTFNTNLYVNYERTFKNKNWSFVNLLRFKNNGLKDPSNLPGVRTYLGNNLSLLDVIDGTAAHYANVYLDIRSNQVRNESRFYYNSNNDRFNLIAALDVRSSAVQGNYVVSTTVPLPQIADPAALASTMSNHYFSRDFGAYAQANYILKELPLKFTAGGRVDYNTIWPDGKNDGYKWVFNPRLAVVYSPKKYVFKGIFATAFKDASNFQKYTTFGPRTSINPGLKPERVYNFEVSARRFFGDFLNIEAVYYYAFYTQAVDEVRTTDGFLQLQNGGSRKIDGGLINATYKKGRVTAYFNYTYTNPVTDYTNPTDTTNTVTSKRISDIAWNQFNIGGTYHIIKGLTVNLRANFVGKKPTGDATNVPDNKLTFKPYVLLNGSVMYSLFDNKIGFQLLVNNIFNHKYASPGIRSASYPYAMRLPQNGINMNLRMYVNF